MEWAPKNIKIDSIFSFVLFQRSYFLVVIVYGMCVCELSVSLSIHKVNMFTSCTQAKFTPTASSSSSPWSTNIQTKAKIIKGYRLQNYMWHSGNKCIVFLYLLCILFVRDHTQYITMFTLIGTIIQIDCSTYTQIPPPSQHFKSIK